MELTAVSVGAQGAVGGEQLSCSAVVAAFKLKLGELVQCLHMLWPNVVLRLEKLRSSM